MKVRKQANDLYKLAASDYEYDATIWASDTDRVAAAKRALARLNKDDRRLLILYAETGSLRKCGKLVGASHTWVGRRIAAIRCRLFKILKEYDN